MIQAKNQWASIAILVSAFSQAAAAEPQAIDIASRRELFVDRYLIEGMEGVGLKLHQPVLAGTVLAMDQPWEGAYSGYTTVFQDGERYRMYYLGYPIDPPGNFTCYAESKDGIHWTRPELGLFEIHGSKKNNVVLAGDAACHNFSPFLDTRPGIPTTQRYKAVGGGGAGLVAFASEDGIHWKRMRDKAVITKGAFDSHNLAFYSEAEGCYVCYFRTFRHGVRWIDRSTSQDFLDWSEPAAMDFGDTPHEHLYTSSTTPYFRAPHIYIALPSRFMAGRDVVSQEEKKALGVADGYQPAGSGFSDMPLLTSRGGNRYERTFLETFIEPGIGPKNWTSRANYPAFGIVATPDSKTHLSIYVNRETGYKTAHLARYTLRYDGFISVHAPFAGGEMITRPLQFAGSRLTVNYCTSAPGSVQIEIQDADGKAIPGFVLAESDSLVGDEIERTFTWKGRHDVSQLAGRPVRLRFQIKAADLYSMRFH